jgi:hypothetical protein
MRKEISDLKKENIELKEDLRRTVLLDLALYQYIGADKLGARAEDLRIKIVKLLGDLRAPVE